MIENFSSLKIIIEELQKKNKALNNELKLLISLRLLKNSSLNSIEDHFRNNFLFNTINVKINNDKKSFLINSIKNINILRLKKIDQRIVSKKNNFYFKLISKYMKETRNLFYKNSKISSSIISELEKYITHCLKEIIETSNKVKNLPEFYSIVHNIDKYKKSFNKNGFIILENFFKKNQLSKISKALIKIEKKEMKYKKSYFYGKDKKFRRSYNLIGKDILFSELILDNNFINALLFKLFNRKTYHEKFYLSSMQSNTVFPGAESQIWHIDSNMPEPIPNWLTRLQVAITIDDFTKSNGSTEFGLKTHLKPSQPKNRKPHLKKKVICKKGSLIIWHGNLWHRSTENNSNKLRKVILCCFANSVLRQVSTEDNFLRLIPKSKILSFSDNTKRLIGYYHGILN